MNRFPFVILVIAGVASAGCGAGGKAADAGVDGGRTDAGGRTGSGGTAGSGARDGGIGSGGGVGSGGSVGTGGSIGPGTGGSVVGSGGIS
ncbi:MAG: hypothetical protein H7X95_07480, partial [Deltaproteobacteria bacterium]|nr:hypothetical protein [Deltaproteobacteria bacterium]